MKPKSAVTVGELRKQGNTVLRLIEVKRGIAEVAFDSATLTKIIPLPWYVTALNEQGERSSISLEDWKKLPAIQISNPPAT